MYLVTFGFTWDPQGSKVMLKLSPHLELGPLSQLQLLQTSLLDKGVMVNGNAKQELPAPQPCSLPPDAVRYETECLRTDFNLRIKQVLFQSLLCAYYVGFIPMKFSEVRGFVANIKSSTLEKSIQRTFQSKAFSKLSVSFFFRLGETKKNCTFSDVLFWAINQSIDRSINQLTYPSINQLTNQ